MYDGVLYEELAMALFLDAFTKGETVFQKVKTYFKKNQTSLTNIIACATDGASSMMGCYHGFNAFLKAANPYLPTNHSVIHQ